MRKNGPNTSAESSTRPALLADYVGQEKLKNTLSLYIEAARARNEPLDHVLLYGPPGLGKTTLATIIANEMGAGIKTTSGPVIERPGDLAAILTNLDPHDVLFIDEIHRLPLVAEEVLYSAMEDCQLDIMIGQGPSARSIRMELPRFTLVGATTRAGMLSAPLRDRFGVVSRLEFYEEKDLSDIIRRSAAILGMDIEPSGASELARRSRGTPRIANRLLRRARDYAQICAGGVITQAAAASALDLLEIDDAGLDTVDRLLLCTLIDKFGGGPVGLETLSAATSEESGSIEDVCEPYLIQRGYLNRTPRGRVATAAAYLHLGRTLPGDGPILPSSL